MEYLRQYHKPKGEHEHRYIDVEQPLEKQEVGQDTSPKMTFNSLHVTFPELEEVGKLGHVVFEVLPIL